MAFINSDNPHLSRLARGLGHSKGSRIKSVKNAPLKGDGQDGDMQIKHGNLYIKDNNIWHHFVAKGSVGVVDKVNQLTDNTGGTVRDIINNSGGSWNNAEINHAIASLSNKINKIIALLQLDETS